MNRGISPFLFHLPHLFLKIKIKIKKETNKKKIPYYVYVLAKCSKASQTFDVQIFLTVRIIKLLKI